MPDAARTEYLTSPDFSRTLPGLPAEARERILKRLAFLYGPETAGAWINEIDRVVRVHQAYEPGEAASARSGRPEAWFDETDMILIAYADMVQDGNGKPLKALSSFLKAMHRRAVAFGTIHILPFYPSTSDRGFAVTDFNQVDPRFGTWEDIAEIGEAHKLMFDAVLNHASSKSQAFVEMLSGNPDYADYAVTVRSPGELTDQQRAMIRRPRTSDILTRFDSIEGPLWCWTTFSSDQIDLNYRNPKVLISVIATLLDYVRRGACLLRLDAVTYLWDEPGTPGANLDQTHEIIKMLRDILDTAAPQVALVTETNVPHVENVSYFGDGRDEAQMVYNFPLPPLVLHAFYREDATALTRWAAALEYPESGATYLNILDTHDGIGLPGVSGILPPTEIDFLIQRARRNGAFVSNRSGENQRAVPYEINATWYSALNMDNSGEPRCLQVSRFVASRSIALALKGVPAIYMHGLVGSRSDIQAAIKSGSKRDVNRAALDEDWLMSQLGERSSKLCLIRDELGRLLETRVRSRSFHPKGGQRVIEIHPQVFSVIREAPGGGEMILCLTNVSGKPVSLNIDLVQLGLEDTQWYDLVDGRGWMANNDALHLEMTPYDVVWLMPYVQIESAIETGAGAR
jgi:sucrose phosphorylase